jgi:hypothetical protein
MERVVGMLIRPQKTFDERLPPAASRSCLPSFNLLRAGLLTGFTDDLISAHLLLSLA